MSPFVLAMAMEDSSNVIVKTPNTETPPQPQPIIGSSISFSTGGAGAGKRRHHAAPVEVLYKECLKNHAAGIGGLALDGCGEFMPSAAAAADPASLKCAACGCHRNFHRRELDEPAASAAHFISFHNPHRLPPPLNLSLTPSPIASPGRSPPPHAATTPLSSAPHTLLALGNGFSGQNRRSRENPVGKKRFRSKFSHTQKQKMRSFAEKLGWKLHMTHESLVEEFCSEIGVTRGVFKVWMHNNKHRDHDHNQNQNHHHNGINKSNGNGNGMNHDDGDDEQNGNGSGNKSRGSFDTDNENQQNEGNSDHLLHVSTNGSSSSS